jgi:hypothetical protein
MDHELLVITQGFGNAAYNMPPVFVPLEATDKCRDVAVTSLNRKNTPIPN